MTDQALGIGALVLGSACSWGALLLRSRARLAADETLRRRYIRVSMILSLAGWPLLAVGVGALFGRTAAIVAVLALLVPGLLLAIRGLLILRRRTPEQHAAAHAKAERQREATKLAMAARPLQPSDVDDLTRAYRNTVSKLEVGRFISLGLIVATVGAIVYGYAADIGPETNPDANGWLGVAFLVLAFGFLAVGIRIVLRDRAFRRSEPDLWKRVSIWSGGGGDYFLRRQLVKATVQHWLTGKDPEWLAEDSSSG